MGISKKEALQAIEREREMICPAAFICPKARCAV
mgnify:CR=1 FL=1